MLILNFDGKYWNYVEGMNIYVNLLYFRQNFGRKKMLNFKLFRLNFVFCEEKIELC